MTRPSPLGLLLSIVMLAGVASAQDPFGLLAAAEAGDDEVVVRSHDSLFGFPDGDVQVLVFMGDVEITRGLQRVQGDTLVLVVERSAPDEDAPATPANGEMVVPGSRVREIFMEGHVTMEEGDERIGGASAMHVDNRTGVVTVLEGRLQMLRQAEEPVIIGFDRMRKLSSGIRVLKGLQYTTCEYGHAHWHIETEDGRITPTEEGRILSTSSNTARVGDTPILWWPGIDINLDDPSLLLKRIDFGSSSRFGTELTTVWGAEANELAGGVAGLLGYDGKISGDWELEVGLYSDRGLFLEPKFSYRGPNFKGRVFGSYINDSGDEDDLEIPIDDNTRGRFSLQHRTWLDRSGWGDFSILDVEVNYFSDRNYLNEYYEGEFKVGKEQETYLWYRDVTGNRVTSLLVKPRLNDFDVNTRLKLPQQEYLPEIERRIAGEPMQQAWLGGAILNMRDIFSTARLRPDEDDDVTESQSNTRAGRRATLTWPIDIGDGDQLKITAGGDLTWFSNTDGHGSSQVRNALLGGIEYTQTWVGIDDTAFNDTWNIDGVRHILEPSISYDNLGDFNLYPEDLNVIDDLELLSPRAAWTLGFRHRLQTHQSGEVRTILDTDIAWQLFPHQDRDNVVDGEGETKGLVLVDMEWKPGADYLLLKDATFDWRAKLDPVGGLAYEQSFLSYHTKLDEERELYLANNKTVHSFDVYTAGLSWVLTDKWTGAIYVQQDMRRHETESAGIAMRQKAHRWYIDYIAEFDRGNSVKDGGEEDSFDFSVRFTPTILKDTEEESLLDEIATNYYRR